MLYNLLIDICLLYPSKKVILRNDNLKMIIIIFGRGSSERSG